MDTVSTTATASATATANSGYANDIFDRNRTAQSSDSHNPPQPIPFTHRAVIPRAPLTVAQGDRCARRDT